MYLKTIDIVGYKSFANKTRIELEPGITGIIGPNGCGKSNVMEAVRWCLGEMSWKSLRASSMRDVIFAGTSKRSPLSMTEVTLTFDNSEGLLPVQYNEVTVARRIFRSGESEYYINKTQCRMRDIRELFMDTGVGVDGYAVIDQGGVAFVLSSKPEDRRALFEEAAGVAKYKAKREEAIRKLDRVEMDMGRLQDTVSLISEQVKKLDSDARRAKLFKKAKVELNAMEAASVLQMLSEVRKDLEVVASVSRPLEEKHGQQKVDLDAQGANLAALNLEKTVQSGRLIDANQKIADVKSQIGRLDERIAQTAVTLTGIDSRKTLCEGEIINASERVTSIDPEIDQAQAAFKEAQASFEAAKHEADTFNESVSKFRQEAVRLTEELDTLKKEALSAVETDLTLKRDLGTKQSEMTHQEAELKQTLKGLEKEALSVEAVSKEIEVLRLSKEEQSGIAAQAKETAASKEAALGEFRKKLDSLSEETLRVHSALAEARARVASLEEAGSQNPYWVGSNAVANSGIEGIVGTVRSLITVADADRSLLEDALGEKLYAVVCSDSEAARAGVDFLKAAGKGRARFLVLSTLPSRVMEKAYPDNARSLMSAVTFDPKHEAAVRFLLLEAYTLDKTLYGDHWVCGGVAERDITAPSIADIGEWRAKVSALETNCEELAARKTALESDCESAKTAFNEATTAVHEEAARENILGNEFSQKEESQRESVTMVELSTSDSARLLSEIAVGLETSATLKVSITEAAEKEKVARRKEGEAAERLVSNKEELDRSEGAYEGLNSRVKDIEAQLPTYRTGLSRLVSEKENLAKTVEARKQEIVGLDEQKTETETSAVNAKKELDTFNDELAVLENDAKDVLARLQELEGQVLEKEAGLRTLKEEADRTMKELHDVEIKAISMRTKQDVAKARLWDDWQLTEEEAAAKYADQEVDTSRMEMLRRRIQNMGNINMAAPEEYEELAKKHSFLTGQIEDLNKAKEDLRSAIAKINDSTRENFLQTFTEVREHFRRLYGVLFEGGEADLILTDPENILETGVDIVAQPAGKRLQSLSLLSGGEQALTAIALLFAFFMVRRSPFCMLDEADAPLDDANTERFVALLKEFQAKTQFLIVSHNKKTMEAADVIYGVTMEELGVSQLISVDFKTRKAPEGTSSSSPAVKPA